MNRQEKTHSGKLLYIFVLLLIILGIAFLLFKRLTSKKAVVLNPIPSVNVTHIIRGNISKEISVMGNILPTDTYYVVAKVGGDIKKVNVENGKFVKKGDPICEIDAQKEIEAAYEKQVGHRISNSQIYRVLYRHGWRKIMPRSRHPKKASEEVIETSKNKIQN